MESNLDLVNMAFNIGEFNFSAKAQGAGAWILAICMFYGIWEIVISTAIFAVNLGGVIYNAHAVNTRLSRPLSAPSVDVIDHRLADESKEQR